MRDLWNNPFSPIYRKKGEEVAAQLAQASSFFQRQPCFENIREGPDSKFYKIAICTPLLISLSPFFRNFTEKLQKLYGSI